MQDAECYIQRNEDRSCLVKKYIDPNLGKVQLLVLLAKVFHKVPVMNSDLDIQKE